MYSEAFFFKAVAPIWDDETRQSWETAQRQQLAEELTFLTESARRGEAFAELDAKGGTNRSPAHSSRRTTRPVSASCVLNGLPGPLPPCRRPPLRRSTQGTKGRQSKDCCNEPRRESCARYSSEQGPAFLVRAQEIGEGDVMFVSTGLLSSWNTLPKTNVMFLFDRILRSMTQSTLPRRNYSAIEELTLPLPSQDHDLAVMLQHPLLASAEPLDMGYIGKEQRGVTINDLFQRGIYRVGGYRTVPASTDPEAAAASEKPIREIPLAVNGNGDESELAPLTREKFEEVASGSQLRWVGAGEEISLAGRAIRGAKHLVVAILAVLVLLLVEMLVLALPILRQTSAVDGQ